MSHNEAERLGDRIKAFEENEAGRRLMPSIPFIIQLNVSGTFYSKLDMTFYECMIKSCSSVMEKFKGTVGFVQADEASIVILPSRRWADMVFAGNIQQTVSVAASLFTRSFNDDATTTRRADPRLCIFDCKVYSVPTQEEAIKFVQYQTIKHDGAYQGIFIRRGEVTRKFSVDEIENLPPKHAARANPDILVKRFSYGPVRMPSLDTVENLSETLFGGNPTIVSLGEVFADVK